jgi:cytochrome P450
MKEGIAADLLLAPAVIEDPYPFYRRLRAEAPVWKVANTGVVTVSTHALVAEATSRAEDFSSNIDCLLYCDGNGLPVASPSAATGFRCWPPPTPRLTRCIAARLP